MARILIVDDAAFMRMMLKDILTKGGFEIAGEAGDGNEAVAKYNAANYDRVELRLKKGQKDIIKAHAESRGESLNNFVSRAISETMELDKK